MCGIVSLFHPGGRIDKNLLINAANTLAHRGPDGDGFYISPDGAAGLGHRRLSIIDLAGGAQPISNERGDIQAVVNGEFYDFEDIRRDLESRGHRFKTRSDSEILLHLYEEYGTGCLRYLRGEFAFALYDESQRRVFAARDRFGIKPLCFAERNGQIFIASEAKAIFAAGFPAAWDDYAFYHAMTLQYVPTDRSLFAGVRQLPPGHFLLADANDLQTASYWDMDYAAVPEEKTDSDWIGLFKNEFEAAVRLRLAADVPVCLHLSGGLDSSAIVAAAMHMAGKPLDCFTVSFSEDGYDELPIARGMAEKLGAPLHVVKITADDMVRAIPDAVWYSEGLSINGHLAGKYHLNRVIRAAGFKVALSGEGADELLAGYPHLRDDLIAHDGADAEKKAQLYAGNDKLAGVFLPHGDTLDTDAVARTLGFTPSFLKAKASLGFRLHGLLSGDFSNALRGHDIFSDVMQAFPVTLQLKDRHPVNQSSYLWTKLTLANYILRTLGDGCEMAHSVEGRVPFLDHILFEKMRGLPVHLKIRDMTEKFILREAAKDMITDTVYRRQKHPFIAPPVSRFSNKTLNTFIRDMLSSQKFKDMPFFDAEKVSRFLDRLPELAPQDQIAAEPVLMTVLTAFLIHERFGLA